MQQQLKSSSTLPNIWTKNVWLKHLNKSSMFNTQGIQKFYHSLYNAPNIPAYLGEVWVTLDIY